LEFLRGCSRRYGQTFTLRFLLSPPIVVVSDPASIKTIFTGSGENLLAGRANAAFEGLFPAGKHSLLLSDGEEHRRHQKLFLPPFHGERMRTYGSVFEDAALTNIQRWPTGEQFSLALSLIEITRETIFRAIVGVHEPARSERLMALLGQVSGFGPAAMRLLPFLKIDLGRFSPWGRFRQAQRELFAFLDDEITKAQKEVGQRHDILAKLFEEAAQAGVTLTHEEVRDEILTLFAAGFLTTAASLSWAMEEILTSPTIHERLLGEVRSGTGEPRDGERSLVEATIRESLRLHPPFPLVLRWIDGKALSVDGYELPPGVVVAPSPFLAHRNPVAYPDPDAFNPDRFLKSKPSPFEYFTFGGGERMCTGYAFALFQMKIVLTTIFKYCDLRLAERVPARAGRWGIILGPAGGTPVVLDARRLSSTATVAGAPGR
jgi:cytochrome P450